MPSIIAEAAQAVADSIATPPEAPSARWRWGTVEAVNQDGTMDVNVAGASIQGIHATQHAMSAVIGDRVRIMYLGTEAVVDAAKASGSGTETIFENAGVTVKRDGRTIIVQCHGITATPGSATAWAGIDLSAYKPSYNASQLVTDASGSAHFARVWVSATDGKVYLAIAGYSSSANWYGTLTYIY